MAVMPGLHGAVLAHVRALVHWLGLEVEEGRASPRIGQRAQSLSRRS